MMMTVPSLTGAAAVKALEVYRRGRRNLDDSVFYSSEDSLRARNKEAAGVVSMQDKGQTEQTQTVTLSKEAGGNSMHDKRQTTEQVGAGTEEPRPPPSGQQSSQDSEEAHLGRCCISAPPNEKPRRRYQRRELACK